VKGSVTTSNINGTAAHIHEAEAGKNGGVIIPLTKNGDNGWTVPSRRRSSRTRSTTCVQEGQPVRERPYRRQPAAEENPRADQAVTALFFAVERSGAHAPLFFCTSDSLKLSRLSNN
jgi:hypothetical protein